MPDEYVEQFPEFKTTDELSDRELLIKMQALRAIYSNIQLNRGFGVVQGYLSVQADRPPEDTGLTWVPNNHDDTVHRASNEEEVPLD